MPLQLGNHRFEWPFQLAPVAIPILGADFLKHYNLLLDVSNQRVFSTDSPTSPSIVLSTSPDFKSAPLKANLLATPKCISDLLAEFLDVISSDGFRASKPRHGITHHLLTQPGPLVFAKSRRLDLRSWHPPWRKLELSVDLILLGPLLSTWSRRRMEAGIPAKTTDG